MATNLEFKAKFQPLDELYPMLNELNAMHHETVDQVDTYFYVRKVKGSLRPKAYEPRLKLREVNGISEGWLIYYERPNREASRYSQYHLCEITDPGSLKSLLTVALGVKTTVKKQREIWMFNCTRIHLDTVADLGQFVELETVFQEQTEAEAMDEHHHVKTALRLDTAEPVAVSYGDLVMQKSYYTPNIT